MKVKINVYGRRGQLKCTLYLGKKRPSSVQKLVQELKENNNSYNFIAIYENE